MQVTKYLDRWLQLLDQHGLLLEDLHDFVDKFDHVFLLNYKWSHQRNRLLAVSRRQQVFDENGVKRFVLILLDQRCLHIWSQFSWLLLQLVNWNLTHHEWKIFCRRSRLHLSITLWVKAHSNVSLVSQSELLFFNDVVNILVFTNRIFWTSIFARFCCLRINFLGQAWVISK